jgi:hypothetical protein
MLTYKLVESPAMESSLAPRPVGKPVDPTRVAAPVAGSIEYRLLLTPSSAYSEPPMIGQDAVLSHPWRQLY